MAALSLHVLKGSHFTGAARIVPKPGSSPYYVGRDANAHSKGCSLSWDGASRQHFSLQLDSDQIYLKSLGMNGTFVNGTKVDSATLKKGDIVGVGHGKGIQIGQRVAESQLEIIWIVEGYICRPTTTSPSLSSSLSSSYYTSTPLQMEEPKRKEVRIKSAATTIRSRPTTSVPVKPTSIPSSAATADVMVISPPPPPPAAAVPATPPSQHKRSLYRQELQEQILDHERLEQELRDEAMMERMAMDHERQQYKNHVEQIRQRKLDELRKLGVPRKYMQQIQAFKF